MCVTEELARPKISIFLTVALSAALAAGPFARFALKDNEPARPYWIVDAEKEPLDDSKYKAGDEVPGIIVAPFTGDRGDIAVKSVWKDGLWTLVFARKLVTGSDFDVQFNDLKKQYAFGVAVFGNAQVRHAYSPSVLKLVFE